MQELKCGRCGADLETLNVEDEGLYGRCTHCRTTYLLEEVDRSHLTVEIRGAPEPAQAKPLVSRRAALIGGGAFVGLIGLAAIPSLIVSGGSEKSDRKRAEITPKWVVGGEGAGPGQFRNYVLDLVIDGQGRSALSFNSSPLVQLHDANGRFVARWVNGGKYARLIAALPGGDLILDGPDGFERRDPVSGRIIATAPGPDDSIRGGWTRSATTPDGGFAIYYSRDGLSRFHQADGSPDDRLAYFDPNGQLIRAVGPLVGAVLRPDPAIAEFPRIAGLAIDGVGSVYLLLHKEEEYDTREGIYVFNADGKFLRKIEVAQKYLGSLAATADGTVYHSDPWSSEVTRIKGNQIDSIDMTDFKVDAGVDLNVPHEIAAFPDGDLGIVTGSHRYLRFTWPGVQDA